MNDLLRRKQAVELTLEKYRDKPFSWKDGVTCIHMLRFHLRQMGYKPPPLPRMKSALAAKRALDARQWADVGDMLDTLLPRITPAQMLMGDIAMFRSEDGFGAITISLGGKVMGWHPDYEGMTALEPIEIEGAWRA